VQIRTHANTNPTRPALPSRVTSFAPPCRTDSYRVRRFAYIGSWLAYRSPCKPLTRYASTLPVAQLPNAESNTIEAHPEPGHTIEYRYMSPANRSIHAPRALVTCSMHARLPAHFMLKAMPDPSARRIRKANWWRFESIDPSRRCAARWIRLGLQPQPADPTGSPGGSGSASPRYGIHSV